MVAMNKNIEAIPNQININGQQNLTHLSQGIPAKAKPAIK